MNSKIKRLLYEWGSPPHLKGFDYIFKAVEIGIKNPESLHSITKSVYPVIAKMTNSTASKVERNIRTAKEISLQNMDRETREKNFGRTTDALIAVPNGLYLTALVHTYCTTGV